jgi:hypothetical protein
VVDPVVEVCSGDNVEVVDDVFDVVGPMVGNVRGMVVGGTALGFLTYSPIKVSEERVRLKSAKSRMNVTCCVVRRETPAMGFIYENVHCSFTLQFDIPDSNCWSTRPSKGPFRHPLRYFTRCRGKNELV